MRGTRWLQGIGFAFAVALLGLGLSKLSGFQIGPLACAIVIAVVYRQIAGYPQAIRDGIQFSLKRLLRVAIILYGLNETSLLLYIKVYGFWYAMLEPSVLPLALPCG